MQKTNIAFIGLGLMGGPMASRLLAAGYPVSVWNRSAAKAAQVIERGGILAGDPVEAARSANIVCLCLTDADAVEDVMFGTYHVGSTLSRASIVIDFSTIGVVRTRALAERVAAESGATWLDCPVSGGVPGAEKGTLVILAGGNADAVEKVRPLLAHLSARVTHMGDVGAGQAAKLCNQLIVTANMLAISEAVALGEKLGINAALLPEALAGGFADSRPLQLYGARMAAARDPGPKMGSVRTMRKDAGAIRAESVRAGLSLQLVADIDALYQRAVDFGVGDEDLPGLMKLHRESDAQAGRTT